ncbi:MAG TPA: hypothetical protein PKA88_14515 [Polyangiaceae bacterium]|nr:hypothetical protein [Polyangiaceae bacterium]
MPSEAPSHTPRPDWNASRATLALAQAFASAPPVGYLRGKTQMRDCLRGTLPISSLEAEALVDHLEAIGLVRFQGDPAQPESRLARWAIRQ